jgi:hypothetical protein
MPLITAPQRAIPSSVKSLSLTAAALALTRIESAKTGVTIAIPASETISFVVTAFIVRCRFLQFGAMHVASRRSGPLQGLCQWQQTYITVVNRCFSVF